MRKVLVKDKKINFGRQYPFYDIEIHHRPNSLFFSIKKIREQSVVVEEVEYYPLIRTALAFFITILWHSLIGSVFSINFPKMIYLNI